MGYSREYYESRSRYHMWQVESQLARELVGPALDGTVVDLGCGAGELLWVLGPKLGIGIDISEEAIQIARSRVRRYEFRVGDAGKPPLADESVDCIVSLHLFEHLPEPEVALRAWHTAITPGGRLVILTPNAAFSHPEEFEDPDHKHLYHGEELAVLVAEAEFTISRVMTVGLWGVRRWPFFWRYQALFDRVRLPRWSALRWRGQTLCLAAAKKGRLTRFSTPARSRLSVTVWPGGIPRSR